MKGELPSSAMMERIVNTALRKAFDKDQKAQQEAQVKDSPTDDTECARQLADYSSSDETNARALIRLRLDKKLLPHLTPGVPSGFTPLAMFQSINAPQEARDRVLEEWFRLQVIDALLVEGGNHFCAMSSEPLTNLAKKHFGSTGELLGDLVITKVQEEAKEVIGKELLKKTQRDAEYVKTHMPKVYEELVASKQQFALASHYANLGRAMMEEQSRSPLPKKTPTFNRFPSSASNTIAIINRPLS